MADKKTNFWGFRINWKNSEVKEELLKELMKGHLRQGWGWRIEQKLPICTIDEGAKRNLPIYNKVKKGDYLLIPHIPSDSEVTIVRATEDFSQSYMFDILPKYGDYGHCFKVEKCRHFVRSNKNVDADIRSSLRTPMRFWNIGCADSILKILNKNQKDLLSSSQYEELVESKLIDALNDALDAAKLTHRLYELFEQSFQSSEWEFVLRKIFKILIPFSDVQRVGGKNEKQHGCDLALFLPTIEQEAKYVIGIQVKDYNGQVGKSAVDQVIKANKHWEEDGYKLIDKYVIVIDANKEQNEELDKYAKENDVKVLYKEDVLNLLARAAKIHLANTNI